MLDADSKKLLENVVEQDALLNENITSTREPYYAPDKRRNALTYSRRRADHRPPPHEP